MNKQYPGKILRVPEGSLADELGLEEGDSILEINGQCCRDIIDLSFAMSDEEIEMLVEHPNGEQEVIAFDKDMDEELGAEFESAVFDGIRGCANHCCFCFVEMVAPNMRQTLYIKDDDYRMSFLYGNFITLTNLGDRDYERIERLHLSPLFVSVHAVNPGVRAQLLRCKRAAEIGTQLDRLEAAGVDYHTQVVLCPGINDGDELERTIMELVERRPNVLSLAIVPVGLTKYRRDPVPLRRFTREEAEKIIESVEGWQKKLRNENGNTFVYLGDEFYFMTGREVPEAEYYDGFPQLDNGIGLTRSFLCDWKSEQPAVDGYNAPVHLDVISGTSVAPVLEQLAKEEMQRQPLLSVRILPVDNEYFGTSVNVSGLLTGKDILGTLQKAGGKRDGILIPESALRSGEDIFLDDMTLESLQSHFPDIRIEPIQTGAEYRRALADFSTFAKSRSSAAYMWQSNAAYTK